MGECVLRTLDLTNKLINNQDEIISDSNDGFRLKAIRLYLMELRKTNTDLEINKDNISTLSEKISSYLREHTTLQDKYINKSEIYKILKKAVEN